MNTKTGTHSLDDGRFVQKKAHKKKSNQTKSKDCRDREDESEEEESSTTKGKGILKDMNTSSAADNCG